MGGPRLLLFDNYDSFTWNLVQGLGAHGAVVEVVRNDAATVADLRRRSVDGLVVSPGPGTPVAAGITLAMLQACPPHLPVLGVCLGHQALGVAFGAQLRRADTVRHGKPSIVAHDGLGIFAGLPARCVVMRYHSLVIDPTTCPTELEITARATDDGAIMGLRHRTRPFEGVQFHPESIGTPHGHVMLGNFVTGVRRHQERSAA